MAVRDIPSNLIARAQSLLNTVVKPDTRQQFYTNISAFANDQPILAVSLHTLTHHTTDNLHFKQK